MGLTQDIKGKAVEIGFDVVGVTDASAIGGEDVERMRRWLQAGCAGGMDYLCRNFEKRMNPALLVDNARSVICVGLNYHFVEQEQGHEDWPGGFGRVARYGQYEDYHPFMKQLMRELAAFIESLVGEEFSFKVCVDSVPLAERALAQRAGLGFIGKNHMLINPELGPELFLGEIITDLELDVDEPVSGGCSGCRKCIEACPTGALSGDGQFDARKCISYLTIEHKGSIEEGAARSIGDRLFGCDRCVMACPYQNNAPECRNSGFGFDPDMGRLDLGEVMAMDVGGFEVKFGNSVIKRLGLEGLKRNALICLENASG
ncbi:MAG: tRNA epoxyqueuosine(34) reductase QueG [Planctomycetota bacterium]|jgi:epoxyqueuosine reductase